MSKAGKFTAVVAALGMLSLAGCGSGDPFTASVGEIVFLTDVLVPPAGQQFGAGVRFDPIAAIVASRLSRLLNMVRSSLLVLGRV